MGADAVTDSLQFSILEQFTEGSRVEVSSDEEGFKGAWYIATILDTNPKKNPQKLYVEYQSLLDEDGSKPLREFVNLEFLRPIPPPEPEKIPCFELYDVVDALYRDVWWTGVIIRVLHNSRFVVAFQNPPYLIEFGVSELRVHREWVEGKWIQSKKKAMWSISRKRTTGLMFSKGEKVEVFFEKEEYRDAWFSATIIEEVWNNSFLVEYQRRGTNGGSEHVKLIVDFLHIRPSPPHLKDKFFVLLDKVDAYIDFGWWSGVITKELADSRYVVFFKPANMEMEVNHSELRLHMDWKDGNWFSASQDVLTSSDHQGHVQNVSYNVNDTEMAASLGSSGTREGNSEERPVGSINLMENQIEQSTPCNEKASNAVTSLEEKTKLPTPDTDDQHSRPSKKLKEASATDGHSLTCQLNITPMDTPSEDTYFGCVTTTNENTRANSSEQPMVGDLPTIKADNFSRGKKARSKLHKPVELDNHTADPLRGKAGRPPKSSMSSTQALVGGKKLGELDNHTPDPSGRKVGGRPPKSPMSSTQASAGDKKEDAAGFTKEKFVEKESVSKEIIVTFNLEHEGMKDSQTKEPHQIPHEESLKVLEDQSQQLHDLAADRIKEGNQLGGGRESISRRKRGRPRKFPAKSPEASAAVNQQNGGVTAYDMVVKDCMKNEVGLPKIAGMEATKVGGSVPVKEYMKPFGVDKKIFNGSVVLKSNLSNTLNVPSAKKDQLQNGKVVQTLDKQLEKHSTKRGRQQTISVNAESPIQDGQDISVGKTAEVYEKDSLAIEEMAIDQLPSNMSDDQPLSMWFEGMQSPKTADATSVYHDRNVEQCTEATRSQKDTFMQSPVLDDTGGIVPGENQSLPFVKNTPLWKIIESMEVFQKMPQKPHFRPLESTKENSREGLAIGYMVNFASVAEKTSSLQFDESRSIIEDNLETLLELENHGFDVKLLRDRLTGLLLMKDKQEELQDQSKENTSRIREISDDKFRIDEKIAEIEKKLCMLREERALALSTKEKKGSEIAYLESAVEHINKVIRSVRLQFETLVAAPW